MRGQGGYTLTEVLIALVVGAGLAGLGLGAARFAFAEAKESSYLQHFDTVVSAARALAPNGDFAAVTGAAIASGSGWPAAWRSEAGDVVDPGRRLAVIAPTALTDRGQAPNSAISVRYDGLSEGECINFSEGFAPRVAALLVNGSEAMVASRDRGEIDPAALQAACQDNGNQVTAIVE
jgi:prepilin-type N-terminal cleavage/methylation domain-containing protein